MQTISWHDEAGLKRPAGIFFLQENSDRLSKSSSHAHKIDYILTDYNNDYHKFKQLIPKKCIASRIYRVELQANMLFTALLRITKVPAQYHFWADEY